MALSDIIKKHASYTGADEVSQICKPLFNSLDLSVFNYSRLYHDNSLLVLDSHGEAFHHFCTNSFPASATVFTKGIHLWEEYQPEKFLRESANYFNMHNGITISFQRQDYIECFNMASSIQDCSAINLYFNQLDLIEQFIFYFKAKAEKLINQAYKERFVIPEAMRGNYLEEKTFDEFYQLIKTNKICMNFRSKEVILSRREYECLLQLAKAKTVKETARILDISPKTVESHLTNAKNKTNCIFKSQLVDMFRNNLIMEH